MISFLEMLVFAPVVWMLTWIYMSPLRRLDAYTPVKVILRLALFATVFGGLLAQLNFIAHRELSKNTRQFYLLALLTIECIPGLLIMFYRYYQDPSSYGS